MRMNAAGQLEPMYLIWSNEHGMWWRAGWAGYTSVIDEAGRYTGEEAQAIIEKSSAGGRVTLRGGWPEVAIMAPETELSQTPGDGLLG